MPRCPGPGGSGERVGAEVPVEAELRRVLEDMMFKAFISLLHDPSLSGGIGTSGYGLYVALAR